MSKSLRFLALALLTPALGAWNGLGADWTWQGAPVEDPFAFNPTGFPSAGGPPEAFADSFFAAQEAWSNAGGAFEYVAGDVTTSTSWTYDSTLIGQYFPGSYEGGSGTLAVAQSWSAAGQIVDCDIRFYGENAWGPIEWSASPVGPAPTEFDFELVAIHELGHCLGLGHSDDEDAIMYAYAAPGTDVSQRELTDDDIAGLIGLYGAQECLDLDGDGFSADPDCEDEPDCDDTQETVHPDAEEVCDGFDNDCDGEVDLDACFEDAGDADAGDQDEDVPPEDEDGLPDDEDGIPDDGFPEDGIPGGEPGDGGGDGPVPPPEGEDIDTDGDGWGDSVDCDPDDIDIYPGAPEICDGLDTDCDGDVLDEEHVDEDEDGFTPCEGDCYDFIEFFFPGAFEFCDGLDNDCDGYVDEDLVDCNEADYPDPDDPTTWPDFPEGEGDDVDDDVDDDGPADGDVPDGEGDDGPDDGDAPEGDDDDGAGDDDDGPAEGDGDGDDGGPADGDAPDGDDDGPADEAPDGGDGDGDGDDDAPEGDDDDDVDVALDSDGDTVPDALDCGPFDRFVYPDAPELCDGKDNDCDNLLPDDEIDEDGDGFPPCTGDCDDLDDIAYPGALELCDGVDTDCDGIVPDDEVDEDEDGQPICAGDCNDGNPWVFEFAIELCDGQDNDCDGSFEDEEVDGDGDGLAVCEGDCDDRFIFISPQAFEVCDGFDNDCNALVDEGLDDCTEDDYPEPPEDGPGGPEPDDGDEPEDDDGFDPTDGDEPGGEGDDPGGEGDDPEDGGLDPEDDGDEDEDEEDDEDVIEDEGEPGIFDDLDQDGDGDIADDLDTDNDGDIDADDLDNCEGESSFAASGRLPTSVVLPLMAVPAIVRRRRGR